MFVPVICSCVCYLFHMSFFLLKNVICAYNLFSPKSNLHYSSSENIKLIHDSNFRCYEYYIFEELSRCYRSAWFSRGLRPGSYYIEVLFGASEKSYVGPLSRESVPQSIFERKTSRKRDVFEPACSLIPDIFFNRATLQIVSGNPL
jgi:hypothetical protein